MDPAPLLLVTDCDPILTSKQADRVAAVMTTNQQPFCNHPYGVMLACPPCPEIEADEAFDALAYLASCRASFAHLDADFYYLHQAPHFAALRIAVLALSALYPNPIIVQLHIQDENRMADDTDCMAALTVLQRIGVATVVLSAVDAPTLSQALCYLAPEANLDLGVRCPAAWLSQGIALPANTIVPSPMQTAREVLDALPYANLSMPDRVIHDDLLLVSDGRDVHYVDLTADISEEIPCDYRLSERLIELEDEGDTIFKLLLEEVEDLYALNENQHMITRPICLCADNPDLLAQALLLYRGTAIYDGTWEHSADVLAQLSRQYGLILL